MGSSNLVIGLVFLPLLGGLIGLLVPKRVGTLAAGFTGLSFVLAIVLLMQGLDASWKIVWIPNLDWFISLDAFSSLLIAVVLFVSFLVQVFSIAYMKGENQHRYFAKIGLFTFSMVGLLLADHLILLFVFWELVGLSSYLLIGFWFRKDKVSGSARLAFMVNRIADASLLAAIILLFNEGETLRIFQVGAGWNLLPSALLAIGAFGKSAQLPFSGWLTKAMVGPTPVSALIHAATMVAAGVYLLVRVSPALHPVALDMVVGVGVATAFYGALVAVFQHDIKKVLAYSTISQLGYMVLGVGVGASDAAAFHLITHAFFKAGLFLAAGSIIHWMHQEFDGDAQDMRNMGGLAKKLPWTFRSFLICGFSLAGLPLFSGFMSKEGILLAAWSWAESLGSWAYLVPDLGLLAAMLTAFYVGRTVLLVFFGETRITTSTVNRSEGMTIFLPLTVLAAFSFWLFFSPNPFAHSSWLASYFPIAILGDGTDSSVLVFFLSIFLGLVGLALAYSYFKPGSQYQQQYKGLTKGEAGWLQEGLYLTTLYQQGGRFVSSTAKQLHLADRKIIDAFLDLFAMSLVVFAKIAALVDRFVIDGPVNLAGSISKSLGSLLAGFSSKDLQTQLSWLVIGMLVILSWFLFFF